MYIFFSINLKLSDSDWVFSLSVFFLVIFDLMMFVVDKLNFERGDLSFRNLLFFEMLECVFGVFTLILILLLFGWFFMDFDGSLFLGGWLLVVLIFFFFMGFLFFWMFECLE